MVSWSLVPEGVSERAAPSIFLQPFLCCYLLTFLRMGFCVRSLCKICTTLEVAANNQVHVVLGCTS